MATIKKATIIKEDGTKVSRDIAVPSGNISIDTIEGLTATNLQDALEEIESQISESSSESNFLTKANPSGTGSLSLNRKASTTVGDYSAALGNQNTASGSASLAFGSGVTSSGIGAQAGGTGSTASGNYSIAVGTDATASQTAAAAFGSQTTASGAQSFAIGNGSKASGASSLAAGSDTEATGFNSVAIGSNTKASTDNSFVIGIYNSTPDTASDEDVLFEIGNGNSSTKSDALYVTSKGVAVSQSDFKLANSSVSMTSLDSRVTDIEDALEAVFASDEVVF